MTFPQHVTINLDGDDMEYRNSTLASSACRDEKQRRRRSQRKRRRPEEWLMKQRLEKTTLLALCCLWLAPNSQSSARASAAAMTGDIKDERQRSQLRKLHDYSPLRHLERITQFDLLQEETSPPVDSQADEDHEHHNQPQNSYSSEGLSHKERDKMIASLLTKSGYNTAFGKEPLCWMSDNHTTHEHNNNPQSGGVWNLTGIVDAEIFFPNPLVADFAYLPGEETLMPACFQNSHLTIQKPKESLEGELLRTFTSYEYQVNLTIDFTELLNKGQFGDAVLTSTPNISQIALQVMHCVLGKSGVCVPFLHEQAYATDYFQNNQKPNASKPGTIHGETHIHTQFIILEVPANQTLLQQSISVPSEVLVEGDYFVLAALQFYTGDSTTNIAHYRWDMANAMDPQDRIVSYQNKPKVQEVSQGALVLSYCLIVAASLIILFLIYQVIKHREEQVLKLSQGEFLVVFLLSALTATVCVFLMEPKNDLYCNLGSTLVLLPVQLMYAITAGRLWRINAVISPLLVEHMRKKTKWTSRFVGAVDALTSSLTLCRYKTQQSRDIRRSIPKWQLAVVVGIFVAPQVFLQLAELIWQPQQRVIELNEEQSSGRAKCQLGGDSIGSSIFLYCMLALLVLIGIVLGVAFSSRKLPSLFNETQVIYDSTFISVILIAVGAGIIALTDSPEVSPDVEYMVWVVATLSLTLNSALRIMIPKLRMIWNGEQVIVSKLVSDHHRKQREKDMKQQLEEDGIHPPDLMRNVTGMEGSFDYNKMSFVDSYGNSLAYLNYNGQSVTEIGYNHHHDGPYKRQSLLSDSMDGSSQERTQLLFDSQVSTGDVTAVMSNVEGRLGVRQSSGTTDLSNQVIREEGDQSSPSKVSPDVGARDLRGTVSTDAEESIDISGQSIDISELAKRRSTLNKTESPAATVSPIPESRETPEAKHNAATESDTETENTASSKRGRRRRWSPLGRSEQDANPRRKRSSDPTMDSSSDGRNAPDRLEQSDHGSAKTGRRRRWSPLRNSTDKVNVSGEAERKSSAPLKEASEPTKTEPSVAESDGETVGSRVSRHNRIRRRWSPLAKDKELSDISVKSNEKGRIGGNRLSAPFRRQSTTSSRRQVAMRNIQREMSVPQGLGGRSPPQQQRKINSADFRAKPAERERMKVTPDETPTRRLVLKLIDLQEQLRSVNKKIISGLVVSSEEWDLLTSLNAKLHNTFENDVEFSWREKAETSVKHNPLANQSRHSRASMSSTNHRNDSTGQNSTSRPIRGNHNQNNRQPPSSPFRGNAKKPPAQISIGRNTPSPPPSPKRERAVLRRGSVANPANLAANFRNIIDVRDRRKGLVKHKKCFVGKDAIDSLIYSGMVSTREEAVQLGKAMVKDMHLIKNVNGGFEFEDDDNLYRFVDLDDCWSSSEEEEGEDESLKYTSILEEEPDLPQLAAAFREAVLVKDTTYRMQTFKNVFIGSEAVDSLVYAGVASTRWEAVQMGRKLAREQRLFKHITDHHDFQDDFLFYRFCADDSEVNSRFFDENPNDDAFSFISADEGRRNDLADKADAFRMYVDVRKRKYLLQPIKDVFVGSEAVDSLVFAGVATSRAEAVELGRTLMKDLHLFVGVRGDDKFSDNPHSFYRFQDAHLHKRISGMGTSSNRTKSVDGRMEVASLKETADVLQQLVEVKDRRHHFRTYKNCFVGAEAVDVIVSNGLADSRAEAVQLGRALARELRLFKHDRDKPFEDSYTFYRFSDQDLSSGSTLDVSGRAMAISRRPASVRKFDATSNSLRESGSSLGESFAQVSQALSMRSSDTREIPIQSLRSSGTKEIPIESILQSSLQSSATQSDLQGSHMFDSELGDSLNASFLFTNLARVPEKGESRSTDFDV